MSVGFAQQLDEALAPVEAFIDALAPWRSRLARVYRLSVEARLESRDPDALGPFAKFSESAKNRDDAYLRECKRLQDEMLDTDARSQIARAFEAIAEREVWIRATDVLAQAPAGSADHRLVIGARWMLALLTEAWNDGDRLAKLYGTPGMQFFWAALKAEGSVLKHPQGISVREAIDRRVRDRGVHIANAMKIARASPATEVPGSGQVEKQGAEHVRDDPIQRITAGGDRDAPRGSDEGRSPLEGSHPLRSTVEIARDRDLADKVLEMLFAPGNHEVTGAAIRDRELSTSSDPEEAARTAYNAIKQKYPGVREYLRFRKRDPPAVRLDTKPKSHKQSKQAAVPPNSHQSPTTQPPT